MHAALFCQNTCLIEDVYSIHFYGQVTVIRTGWLRKSAARRSMRGGMVAENSKASHPLTVSWMLINETSVKNPLKKSQKMPNAPNKFLYQFLTTLLSIQFFFASSPPAAWVGCFAKRNEFGPASLGSKAKIARARKCERRCNLL